MTDVPNTPAHALCRCLDGKRCRQGILIQELRSEIDRLKLENTAWAAGQQGMRKGYETAAERTLDDHRSALEAVDQLRSTLEAYIAKAQ